MGRGQEVDQASRSSQLYTGMVDHDVLLQVSLLQDKTTTFEAPVQTCGLFPVMAVGLQVLTSNSVIIFGPKCPVAFNLEDVPESQPC